ncbi:prefoldin subunit alpha [Candidatus Woesearchaeota archaeon]|nr:prefoldin subunit alpha [Candidatus Woesearchaeota archaeon]
MTDKNEKYSLLQLIDQQMRQTQKQVKNLRAQHENLLGSMQALDDLPKCDVGSPLLVPITGGIFVAATLQEKDMVTVNIGADTMVRKDLAGARKLLEEQVAEVEAVLVQLTNDLKELSAQAQKLQGELQ